MKRELSLRASSIQGLQEPVAQSIPHRRGQHFSPNISPTIPSGKGKDIERSSQGSKDR